MKKLRLLFCSFVFFLVSICPAHARVVTKEENQLRDQIKAAMQSGDIETARQLKKKVAAIHQKNAQQKIQDRKNIKKAAQ